MSTCKKTLQHSLELHLQRSKAVIFSGFLEKESWITGLHADFACLLYSMLENKLPEDIVHDMIKGAVEVERDFICGALPCDLIGMNKAGLGVKVQVRADLGLVAGKATHGNNILYIHKYINTYICVYCYLDRTAHRRITLSLRSFGGHGEQLTQSRSKGAFFDSLGQHSFLHAEPPKINSIGFRIWWHSISSSWQIVCCALWAIARSGTPQIPLTGHFGWYIGGGWGGQQGELCVITWKLSGCHLE